MDRKRIFLVMAGAVLIVTAVPAGAQVYKWKDEQGVTHYSNKAPFKNAKPTELPPIMKTKMKLPDVKLQSCAQHGGVDCAAGPDTDGSVICQDGFKEAAARFRLNCHSPALAVSEIGELKPDGTYSVFVRNTKSVPAEQAAVIYQHEGGKEVKLQGPDTIAAFGTAEFTLQTPPDEPFPVKPTTSDLKVTCGNCS